MSKTRGPGLTEPQRLALAYLRSGKPRVSFQQMAHDSGLGEHGHLFVQAVAGLLMKGYIEVSSDEPKTIS